MKNRHSIRLKNYDYSQNGAYFVTICTQDRECLFGGIMCGAMVLNNFGKIVSDEWLKTPQLRPNVELDAWVVMPNHFHGIIVITDCRGTDCRGTARRAPTVERFGQPISGSVPTIVRAFKSAVTKQINQMVGHGTPCPNRSSVWQRNYYEHIIRDESSMNCIREYIQNNPLEWELDENNPNNCMGSPLSLRGPSPPSTPQNRA